MEIGHTDFDYERAYAVNVAARQYPTFVAYAMECRLSSRFTPDEVAQIRAVYEQWHSVILGREPVLA